MTLHRATEPIVAVLVPRMIPIEVHLPVVRVRIPIRVRNAGLLTGLICLTPRSRPRRFFRVLNSAQT